MTTTEAKPQYSTTVNVLRYGSFLISILAGAVMAVLLLAQIILGLTDYYEYWKTLKLKALFETTVFIAVITIGTSYLGQMFSSYQAHRQGFEPKRFNKPVEAIQALTMLAFCMYFLTMIVARFPGWGG